MSDINAMAEIAKGDEEFQSQIIAAAKTALLVQIELMNNGTPEARLAAARTFNPVLVRVLNGGDGDDEVAEAKAKMRKVISGMLKPKQKTALHKQREDEANG